MKKILSALLIASLSFTLLACGGSTTEQPPAEPTQSESSGTTEPAPTETEPEETDDEDTEPGGDFKVTMVTDLGGVFDQSFNQSAWEGLQKFIEDGIGDANYIETTQMSEISANLDVAADGNADLIWGIGFLFGDQLETAAMINPDTHYGIVDFAYGEPLDNVTGVVFRAQEPSFMVGYIAARTSKTGVVGFVGGMSNPVIDQFENGYKAGVAYANKEQNLNVEVLSQYVGDFSDESKAKAIANQMFAQQADIVFHAAGQAGNGAIAAAKEAGNLAIGVDRDQKDLAPDNVLTSAVKLVGAAMYDVSKKFAEGEEIGGQTYAYGLAEGGCGIPAYEDANPDLLDKEIYDGAMTIQDKIISGEIVAPATPEDYDAYVAGL